MLVKAQKQLLEQDIFCNLILIGEDSDGNNIPHLVRELGLTNYVWFYGPCYDENEIGNLIYNSDVCITPGAIGLTTIHSLTYGTPVITNNHISSHGPEFEAIEIGVTGDFFSLDDLEDLCQKIRAWINVGTVNRNILRMQAYKKVDEIYNPNNQINILKEVLNK